MLAITFTGCVQFYLLPLRAGIWSIGLGRILHDEHLQLDTLPGRRTYSGFIQPLHEQTITRRQGLYPTVIIYLVQRQSTSWDTPELTKSLANFRASPRQFERDVEKSEDDASTDVHGTSTTQGMTVPSMSFASGMFGSTVQEKAKGERLGHQHSASDDTAVAKMESKTDDLSVS